MSAERRPSDAALPIKITRKIDAACDEFEASLRFGGSVAIEPYLGQVEIPGRELLVRELTLLALAHLQEEEALDPIADLLKANPALREELSRISLDLDRASTAHMIWKTNFGNHSGSGASATTAVPEPATLWMLLTGILTVSCRQGPRVP